MLEFFIFLFGGVHYGSKIASEKAESKRHDKKVAAWRSAFEAWQARVVSHCLESEIEELVKNRPNSGEDMGRVDGLCAILPDDQKRSDNYIRILLANRGKIRAIDAVGGIRTPVYYVDGITLSESIQKRMAFNAYMRWLDNELRNNGIVERMVFVPMTFDGADEKHYFELCDVDKLESLQGTFKWAPQVSSISL